MNNSHPLVSVIIPTYNHATYIGEALDSVLQQTYENLEIIIIDNYSDDNTEQIVSSIKDLRIQYWKFHNNGVIAASRNFGVDKANGKIIAFLDSDDVWEPEKLHRQVQHLERNNDISIVASNYYIIGESPLWRNRLNFDNKMYKDYYYQDLILDNTVINSSAVVKREVFDKVGGLDEDPQYFAFEDWDLWLRCCRHGKLRIISTPVVGYRIHSGNAKNKLEIHTRSLNLLKKHRTLGYLDSRLFNNALGVKSLLLGRSYYTSGDRTSSIKQYLKAFWYANGAMNKVRSLFGILISLLPKKIGEGMILTANSGFKKFQQYVS